MRYPFLLLDVGETLIEPRGSYGSVYSRALAAHGHHVVPSILDAAIVAVAREICAAVPPGVDRFAFFDGGEAGFWRRLCGGVLVRTGIDEERSDLAASILAQLEAEFREPATWHVYPDVPEILAELRGAGVRMAIVSNWDSRLPRLLERLDLARYFDAVLVSHLEGVEKPSPELFRRALALLRARPADALHVGNDPALDLGGAHAAGVDGLLVTRRRPPSPPAVPDLRGLPAIVRRGGATVVPAERSASDGLQ